MMKKVLLIGGTHDGEYQKMNTDLEFINMYPANECPMDIRRGSEYLLEYPCIEVETYKRHMYRFRGAESCPPKTMYLYAIKHMDEFEVMLLLLTGYKRLTPGS